MDSRDNEADLSDVESRTTLSSEVDEVDNLSTNQNKQMDRETEEAENEDAASTASHEDLPKMSAELETAHKILSDLMLDSKKAVNWPFMESVQESAPELYDEYRKKIDKPMWLKLMKEKFDKREYNCITEFVSDFRLMLENCYRFNGPDHYISKRGQKLETMLEQKLALLSRDLREKTSIEATSGIKNNVNNSPGSGMRRRQKNLIPHDSTSLLNQLREQEQQKVREWRKKQILDRKAEKEALAQEILGWEDSVLFSGKYREHMKAMWEIPQIGLFLFLCQVPLNIGEVMHFELERCFLIPRESSTMQLVMTSLLSTPFQRMKIDKKSLMPYKVWEYKLRIKVQQWYKAYIDNDFDPEKAWLKTGIDEEFFEIVGTKNPLEKKKFHQLTFYKKVWLVKSLCDYCLQTQESLRETIELQPFADQREYLLGTDADGKRYIHFPQFCGADVRVYRQAPVKYPKMEIKPDPFDNKRKFPLVYKPPPKKKMRLENKEEKVKKLGKPSPQPSPSRQRPSRLRQSVKPVIPLQIGDSATSTDTDTSDNSDDESDNQKMDIDETGDCDNSVDCDKTGPAIKDGGGDKNDLIDNVEEEEKSVDENDRLSSASDVTIAYGDNSDSNSSISSHDCSRESSPYLSTDLRLRRSARLDKFSDTSRETSPMIYDSDNGLPRSGRSRTRLKTPSYKASRNLTSMLIDENSTTSNSSAFGEPSISGILTERLLNNANLNVNSTSSETGEESVDCDIQKLFSNAENESNNDSSQSVNDHSKDEDGDIVNNDYSNIGANKALLDKSKNESESGMLNGISNINGTCAAKEVTLSDTDNQSFSNKLDSLVKCIPNGGLSCSETKSSSCNIASHAADRSECTSGHQEMCLDEVENDSIAGANNNGKHTDKEDLLTEERESSRKSNTGKSPISLLSGVSSSVETMPVSDKGDVEANLTIDGARENSSNTVPFHVDISKSKDLQNDTVKDEATDITNGEMEEVAGDGKQESESSFKNLAIKIKQESKSEEYNENDMKGDSIQMISSDVKVKLTANTSSCAIDQQTLDDDKKAVEISVKLEPNVNVQMKSDLVEPVKEEEKDLSDIKMDTVKEHGPESEEEEEEEEEEEIVPDLNEFELLADSVEELRKLTSQFEEPEPIIIRKGKKEQISRPPPRKKCVVHLHERLQFLLKELEPWEGRLVHATKRARIRIRKEVEDYVEPPETEDATWNSTDEETESGASDDDTDKPTKDGEESKDGAEGTGKFRANSVLGKQSRENVSGASTPVKLEDSDDIDVSQRGRLRKRRIIPNNAEDQIAPKKLKPKIEISVTQDTPTPSQPIIIQSGKSQMVDYSDILRQLKIVNSKGALPSGVNPVLIKTTQGGRTLLTSVMPLNKSSDSNSSSVTQKLQNIRLISPLALQQQLAGQNVHLSLPSMTSSTSSTKISQHPTIQNLLTGSATTMPSGGKDLSNFPASGSMVQILPQSIKSESVMVQPTKSGGPTLLTPVKTGQSGTVMVTPEKLVNQDQVTPQKLVINQNITPRKIAPYPISATGAAVKGTVKYYAANASTLPINVVQQLLATRGAKLQTGPNQQSILYIPMESDGETRNVAPVPGKYVSSIPQTQSIPTVIDSHVKLSTASVTVSSQGSVVASTKSKSPVTSNLPILPKPPSVPSTSPVFNVSLPTGLVAVPVQQGTNLSAISPNQLTTVGISKTVKTIFQSRLAAGGIALNPTSPPRYPTNETVRTLLDKRKFVDEKVVCPPKPLSESIHTTYTCIASQLQRPCPSTMTSSVILKKIAASAEPPTSSVTTVGVSMSSYATVTKDPSDSTALTSSLQQHVLTSISPAKLNTLLLQTSAAGAKTIPTMIKLPSKAVLDSAVKAVVTSIPTTIPTLNIKVPSPTTLPSIGLRRNVTKTIQTMKSPIPVAPKVVTQNSGRITLSVADSNCLLSTQSTLTSSKMGNTTLMSAPTNTAPMKAHLATFVQNADGKKVLTKIPAPHSLSSEAGVQVGYLTPQGYVIPKLQQNTGSASASAILNQLGLQSQMKQELTGNQSSTSGMQLVQNAEGLLQLVPKVNLQTQLPTSKGTLLQIGTQPNASLVAAQLAKKGLGTKQVVAINAQGKHIIVKQKVSTSQSQLQTTDPTTILPNTNLDFFTQSPLPTLAAQPQSVSMATAQKPAVINQNIQTIELKSPGTNYILPHTMPGVVNQVQSPAVTQPAFSPLLNMQQVLLPGAGFQLASPVMNPVGLNLLQTSVPPQSPTVFQSSQNMTIQTSHQSAAGQPVVNINTALLNQALLSNIGQHQLKVSPVVNVSSLAPGTTSRPVLLPSGTVLDHPLLAKEALHDHSIDNGNKIHQTEDGLHIAIKQNQNRKTPDSSGGPIIVSGSVTGVSSNCLTIPNPSQTTPSSQMVFQYAIPPQSIVSPTMKTAFPSQSVTATTAAVPRQLFMTSSLDKSMYISQIPRTVQELHVKASQTAETHTSKMITDVLGTSDTQPVNQQSVTSKPNQPNQKLLLYSIGGQLVTGQGVPVTLHQGVLKVMPQGKLQIANQTLTPEQIKQTLAKIGGATVPAQPGTSPTGQSAISSQVTQTHTSDPVMMVVDQQETSLHTSHVGKSPVPTMMADTSAMDHAYQHKQKTGTVPARVKRVMSTGGGGDADIKLEPEWDAPKSDIVLKGANANSVYIMKPMTYSSGYTVFPSTIKNEELEPTNSIPVVREMNLPAKVQGQREVNFPSKLVEIQGETFPQMHSIVNKSLLGVNGKEESSLSDQVQGIVHPDVRINSVDMEDANVDDMEDGDDDDDDGHHLIIDDSANEKEAALNLLTLANQALGPTAGVSVKKE